MVIKNVRVINKDFNVHVVVGCNFNSRFSYLLKKILGVSTGDPSVPRDIRTTFSRLRAILEKFYEISDDLEAIASQKK